MIDGGVVHGSPIRDGSPHLLPCTGGRLSAR